MFDNKRKKLISYILVFSMICATLATVSVPASAADIPVAEAADTQVKTGYDSADDVQYKTETVGSKTYTLNWGAQGELCIFLSERTEQFYVGDYTYATLSQLDGGTSDDDAAGSVLYAALHTLMESNHENVPTYTDNQSLYKYTDCQVNDISTIFLFYTGKVYSSEWNGRTWNQEHIWPNSKCITAAPQKANDSADIVMLRPAAQTENSSRNNTAYGEGEGYFTPIDSLKGDCARVILYYATRWGKMDSLVDGADGVISSIDLLLDWMELDPVDTFEMGRNDAVESITGTRNVFVDYPELAWQMFGEQMPEEAQTPSNNDGEITYMEREESDTSSAKPTISNGKYTYTFANYPAGMYVGKDETHIMDENLTLYTDEAYFTTELRLYNSTIGHSKAIFEARDYIHSVSINAGQTAGMLNISASNNGEDWKLVDTVTVTASYSDHSLNVPRGGYQFIKIESTAAIRLKSITFEYGEQIEGALDGNGGSGNTSRPTGKLATFEFGSNGAATHADGSAKASYTDIQNGYTLNLTDGSSFYTGSRDAKGNSCVKLGKGSAIGSCNFTVTDDVAKVVIYAAKYKSNKSELSINGEIYALTKNSNDGEYDVITIDTSENKEVALATTSSGYRCMINTIEFWGVDESELPEETTETKTEAPTEETTTETEETTTKVEETTSVEETTTKEEQTTTEAPATETTEATTVETTEETTTEATETPTTETTEETTTETTETPTIETTEIPTTETTEATATEATEPPVIETTEESTEASTESSAETSAVGGVDVPAKTGCGSSIGGGFAVIISISLAAIVVGRKEIIKEK